ncbi:ELOVL4 (predicted) [Pycnogonum litorale]
MEFVGGSELLSSIYSMYATILENSDSRVSEWFLMSSPLPTVLLSIIYLMMVVFGPKFMSDRQPYNVRPILIVYNFIVVFLNFYVGSELLYCSVKAGYNWLCQLVNYSNDPLEIRIARALYWYYISKLIEFCDTFFFIIRKKNNQLTFLHVYHHVTMFCLWWIGVKYVAGGSSVPGAMLNSFVHVFMYLYYGLAAVGPVCHPYLFWKRYLTILQLVQFSAALVVGISAILTGCQFTLWMQYALVIYMMSFIVLFANFYKNSYCGESNLSHASVVRNKDDNRRLLKNGLNREFADESTIRNGHESINRRIIRR